MGTPVLVPWPYLAPSRCALSFNQWKQPGRRSAFSSRLLFFEQVPPEPSPHLAIAHFVTFGLVDSVAPAQPSLNEQVAKRANRRGSGSPRSGLLSIPSFFAYGLCLWRAENIYAGGQSSGLSSTTSKPSRLAAFFLRSTRRQPKRAGPDFVVSRFPIPKLRMVNSRISLFVLRRQFSAQRGIPIQQTQRDLLRLALPQRNVLLPIRIRSIRRRPDIVRVLLQSRDHVIALCIRVHRSRFHPCR